MAGLNDDALRQAAEDIFANIGSDIAATYYPTDGDPVSCKVNVEKESGNEPDGFQMQLKGESITLECPRHVLGKIPIARTPNRDGEKFIVDDGTVYEVVGIQDADEFFVTCSVKVCE